MTMPPERDRGQVASTRWDPAQYETFSDHRLRPALELLGRVPPISARIVYDLGCGTGEITRRIAERWPEAAVSGLDSSQEMLQKAGARPGPVRWVEADVRTWQPDEPPDLIYSNAALQWVGEHERLFPRLVETLAPGGYLAVQMPLSWDAPSHRLMRETLEHGGPGGSRLGSDALSRTVGRKWVADAEEYYDLLVGYTRSLDIWETEYLQVLSGEDPVLEWVKGTGLRPILNGLDAAERATFLDEYRRRLQGPYPVRPDGHTLYPFRRLFIVAAV
ncbi:MAG: methyltransferase domain-containing protein [Chloroflexi bacterium]|nr:methyltransferase domain-containing protein [Chloroflexota bacterium]